MFWRYLGDWEAASGKGFEAALPGGSSDANHPQAVSDSVADFWTLLRDLDARGQLPAEIFGLEIGVGSGARAAAWLDRFKALDEQCGTSFYSRLHFILGDYSPTSLERAVAAVAHHGDHVSGVPLDALNPFKALAAHRFKIMYVHLTNVYDNLPFDDLVRRDGKLYLVEVRAYLNGPLVDQPHRRLRHRRERTCRRWSRSCSRAGRMPSSTARKALRSGGGSGTPSSSRSGCACSTTAKRITSLPVSRATHLEDLLAEAPDDVRFHISRGAGESFANTLAAAAPARLPPGAGHLRQRDGRLPQGLQGTGKAGRIAGDLGERSALAGGRRARRL